MIRNAVEPGNRLYGFTLFRLSGLLIFRRSGLRIGGAVVRETPGRRSPGSARLANQRKHR